MRKLSKSQFIYVCIISISTLLLVFSTAITAIGKSPFNKSFSNSTYIGPFDMTGLTTKEAQEKLELNLSELYSIFDVSLIYQDLTIKLPVELVDYDVISTLENAASGGENPIHTTVSAKGLKTILNQQLASVPLSDSSIKAIASGIEKKLESGFMPINIFLIDYVNASDLQETQFANATISMSNPSKAVLDLIEKLDSIRIESNSTFSMLEFLTASGNGLLNDEELTQVASVLYATVLQTNFQIEQRTISSRLPQVIQPGFEAAINKDLGLDFVFTNPNRTAYTVNISYQNSTLQTSLTGIELLYSYEPFVGTIEEYEPRTVRRFSSFVPVGQVKVESEGTKGVDVELLRTISHDGSIIHEETISTDFYAPLPKIEVHPLVEQAATSDANQSDANSSGAENNGTEQNVRKNEPTPEIPSNLDSETSVKDDKPKQPAKSNGQSKPNNKNDNEVEYDKGGNVIK